MSLQPCDFFIVGFIQDEVFFFSVIIFTFYFKV